MTVRAPLTDDQRQHHRASDARYRARRRAARMTHAQLDVMAWIARMKRPPLCAPPGKNS